MKVLVAGATGVLGRRTVRLLVAAFWMLFGAIGGLLARVSTDPELAAVAQDPRVRELVAA